ncbi:MAG: DUF4286 family protein [Gammaproteobacteria bacterium]
MADAVIYEVTLDAQADIVVEFDAWLTQHVHDMLQLPGFLDARILHPQFEGASGDEVPVTTIRRVVQYTLVSQSALDNYFKSYAERMRAGGIERFGDRISASRRVYKLPVVVASANATPPVASATLLRCQNCDSILTGNFCAVCGQKNHTYAAPLWNDIQDFFGTHFGFDTKFFHSILPLLFRPGFLSREYSAGRRVRYINPLRLYFFSSLLFFFIAWTFANPQFVRFNDSSPSVQSSHTLTQAEQQKIENSPYLSDKQKNLIINGSKNTPPGNTVSGAGKDNNIKMDMFGMHFNMPITEFRAKITHALETSLPKLMFVFLPLVALLLKLFYIRSKRFYMEHLIFTLHNHAFVFVAMIFIVLAGILAKHAAWAVSPAHYFNVIIGWYMAIYIFLAMRFYYRQSFFKTLVKYLLIGFIYWVTMFITFVAGMVLILAEVITT